MKKALKYIASIGNVIYVLWIIRNGIDEGLSATNVQIVPYISLIILLLLNTVLLYQLSSVLPRNQY